jgi:NAD(P)-dependent dehydrogenase (short-subunit alcohol dehydrogenase family)
MSRNIVLIGGTTGIGKALKENLEKTDVHLYIASRSATSRLKSGDNVTVADIDATDDSADWSFLPEEIHGMVYLGGSINLKPFQRLSNKDFIEDFNVNVIGAVNTIQASLPGMKKAESAAIVLLSTVAVQKGLTFHASVAAAKGGVEGLIRSLSAELAPTIRVNGIALSLTDTPMADRLLSNDSKKEAGKKRHPLKRYGKPEDISEAVAFLLGEKASWITGQILGVDGGMSTIQNL